MPMWFQKKTPPPTPSKPALPHSPVNYPTGTAVINENGDKFYIQKDGKRYRIQSDEIFWSWRFPLVVYTSEIALKNYPVAVGKYPFRDGTLLNNFADGKLYLVSESKLRHITSPDVLARLHKTADKAMVVSQADINIMRMGDELN